MRELISHSHAICTQAATGIMNLANQADLRHYLAVSPTTLIYAVFQGALIHIYNLTRGNSKTESKFNLRRSMTFLSERKKWSAVSRVIEILKLLFTLNGITDSSFVPVTENQPLPDTPELSEDSTRKKRRKRIASSSKSDADVQPKLEDTDFNLGKSQDSIPSISAFLPFTNYAEDEIPKGQWIQRMMNTSVVGGISPEIQSSMSSVLSLNPNGGGVSDNHSNMHNMGAPNVLSGAHNEIPRSIGIADTADPMLLPWHHIQMLPQNFTNYLQGAGPSQNENLQTSMKPEGPAAYYQYSGGNHGVTPLADKPEYQQQDMANPSANQFHPTMPPSMSRQRQDMNMLFPPGSLNWEDWTSYVDQETNRYK
jgi:hypothetical protein